MDIVEWILAELYDDKHGKRLDNTDFGLRFLNGRFLSVCPEMIFRLRKPFGNKDANSDCLTGRKTSLFSNFFGNLDNNSLWL